MNEMIALGAAIINDSSDTAILRTGYTALVEAAKTRKSRAATAGAS